jgi:uncharacterized membrane protein
VDLSAYSLVLFAHILSAMVLVGSSLFAPLVRRAIQAAGTQAELKQWLALGRRAALANPAASLVLLGTGIQLGRAGWWTQSWFWVAVSAWLVNSVLAVRVVKQTARAVAIAASRAGEGVVGVEIDRRRRSRAWELAERAIAASDVAVLFLMIDKPGLLPSIVVLALVHAAFVGASVVRGGIAHLSREAHPRPDASLSQTSRIPASTATVAAIAPRGRAGTGPWLGATRR